MEEIYERMRRREQQVLSNVELLGDPFGGMGLGGGIERRPH